MRTPIVDFVKNYIDKDVSRFHMPGHKGTGTFGFEKYDITEISGADDLSDPCGIIRESEDNASAIFDTAHSFYITQGSTTAICAMLALVKNDGVILAARNVHKAFVHACALLDFEVSWIMPKDFSTILKCEIAAEDVEQAILKDNKKIAAVYLTSPDYLGNVQDIRGISRVCKKYSIPLLVDNAHGAYLKFLEKSLHPIDLGATLCCDSAHKTLPVLTGGAYLHVSKDAENEYLENTRDKISLFSSTSPSYLILQSLDACNSYLERDYKNELSECIKRVRNVSTYIKEKGFMVLQSEPLKVVIDAKASGYLGDELAEALRKGSIEAEFFDNDYLVLMVTPQNTERDFNRLKDIFSELKIKERKKRKNIKLSEPQTAMSVREAVFSQSETVDVFKSEGRICADLTVSCPPAVPVAISGERITKEIIDLFNYYGIKKVKAVK